MRQMWEVRGWWKMIHTLPMAIILGVSVLAAVIAGLTAVSFCRSIARATVAEKLVPEVAIAAMPEVVPEVFPRNLTGQVVWVDNGSRRMTVEQSGGITSEKVTFAVAEPAAPMLAELQPGDLVRLGYVEAHGQFIARAITMIPAEHETGR